MKYLQDEGIKKFDWNQSQFKGNNVRSRILKNKQTDLIKNEVACNYAKEHFGIGNAEIQMKMTNSINMFSNIYMRLFQYFKDVFG
jgi:hypothetical protein